MIWVFLSLLSFQTGVFLINFLTVHPSRMNFYLNGVWISVLGGMAILTQALVLNLVGLGIALWVGFFLAGYTLQTRIFLSHQDPRPVPALTRQKGEAGDGHTAVIYFSHGEPETYDPIGWLNQFREFDEQKIPFIPLLARPFFVCQLRKKYLQVGMSRHRQMHQRMVKSLEQAFRLEGDITTRFYLCFLDDYPRPDAAVIQALNEGASRIIVAEVFVSVSNHTQEGKHLIDALGLEEYGIPIDYTGPLWDSQELHRLFLQRANNNLGGMDKSRVGVLLVGHGQPDEWDREYATETEHEIQFRRSIMDLLASDGYCLENLGLAWMEFKKPKPANIIEQFIQNGVEKILYFPAAISADSIHSQYDIPELVHRARRPQGFPLVNLGAWNDDPQVIGAIKSKIIAVAENQSKVAWKNLALQGEMVEREGD
jgi:sirohydrochlorin ferrochelatase